MLRGKSVVALCAAVLTIATAAMADPIPVGSGSNHATLIINWKDGAICEFDVAFSDPSVKGRDLFAIVQNELPLVVDELDFGFGPFVDGISFQGHSNIGYGGGEDWWHYWLKNGPTGNWFSSGVGYGARTVYNGYSDGWVYGREGAPAVPEPATLALLGAGVLAILRRRARR